MNILYHNSPIYYTVQLGPAGRVMFELNENDCVYELSV